jgi:hypothetical protein
MYETRVGPGNRDRLLRFYVSDRVDAGLYYATTEAEALALYLSQWIIPLEEGTQVTVRCDGDREARGFSKERRRFLYSVIEGKPHWLHIATENLSRNFRRPKG